MGCVLCMNAEGNGMFWYFYHGLSGVACRSSLCRSDKQPSQRHWMSSLPHVDKSVALWCNRKARKATKWRQSLYTIVKQLTLACELTNYYDFFHTILILIHFIRHQYWFAVWKGTNECARILPRVRRDCCCTLLCLTNVLSGLAVSRQIASSITSLVLEWAWIWDCQAEWQAEDGR